MVSFNVELCTYEIVLKYLTGPVEREGFFLYLCISLFGVGHGAQRIGDWFHCSIQLFLLKDCS